MSKFENGNFIDDLEKMRDFKTLSKEEFLNSYSYLTEAEYENTVDLYREKQGLLELLYRKNADEYITFKEQLRDYDVDTLISADLAYEIVTKKDFMLIIEWCGEDFLTIEQIKKLLNVENLLEILYDDWLKYDDDGVIDGVYKEFIFGFWDWEALK